MELRDTQVRIDTPKAARKEMRAIAEDAGLFVSCLTARQVPDSGPQRDDYLAAYLDLCNDLGCAVLKIQSDTEWLHEAAETARRAGVGLATNNHINGPLETVRGTREYLRAVDHDNMGLLYDSLHLFVAGEGYIGCLEEFIGRTRNVLVHSATRSGAPGEEPWFVFHEEPWYLALPDAPGIQNWPAIVRTLKRLDYDGLITVFESRWPTERREQVARHCATYLRDLWETIE